MVQTGLPKAVYVSESGDLEITRNPSGEGEPEILGIMLAEGHGWFRPQISVEVKLDEAWKIAEAILQVIREHSV